MWRELPEIWRKNEKHRHTLQTLWVHCLSHGFWGFWVSPLSSELCSLYWAPNLVSFSSQFPIWYETWALCFVPKSTDSMLGIVGGSSSSLFVWNQSTVSTFRGLLVQSSPQPSDSTLGTTSISDSNSYFEWKTWALILDSMLGPAWFSLQLPICLESFPRFHVGNCWCKLQLSICN